MIGKKLAVPLSMIILFCYSITSIAGDLHFGIIKAVENRLGELDQKIWEKRTTQIQATTEFNGTVVIHDYKNDVDVTVSTMEEKTGQPIGEVQFEYINTGNAILCIAKSDSDYFPAFAIEPVSGPSGSAQYGPDTDVVGIIAVWLVLGTVVLSAYGVYDLFFEDPPFVETIREDHGWVLKRACWDIEDVMAMITPIPFVKYKTAWVKFAVAGGNTIAKTDAEKGLDAIGIDPYEKHCYNYYELRADPTIKAPFMFIADDVSANQPPTVSITGGPSGTIDYDDVTFTWSGSDTDGTVAGYYYDLDDSTPDTWTTGTSHTLNNVSQGSHTFHVQAQDNDGATSPVASRSFTYSPRTTADITFTMTPTVWYIDVPGDVTYTVSESNGIGVDLNYVKTMLYDEQGNLYEEQELQGQEAQDMFDYIWGTHDLPPNGTLQNTLDGGYIETDTPGRGVATIGGTDDNGNFVTDSCEVQIRAGSAARLTPLSSPVGLDWILFGAKQR